MDKYCPQCRQGYREGFDTCADCHRRLIPEDQLPPVAVPAACPENDLEMVLTTSMQSDIAMIKQILDREEIPYHVQGDSPQPFGVLFVPMMYPATLRVPSAFVDAARIVLAEAGLFGPEA